MSSRKRSAVWNHFTEVEPKKARCAYCTNILSVASGNAGNLNRHLKSKHPTVALVPERLPMVVSPAGVPLIEAEEGASSSASSEPQPLRQLSKVNRVQPQPTMAEFVQSSKPLPPRRTEKFDEQLVMMIAKAHHPFSIVEEPEFRKFISMLCPGYSLPTRKTISESLLPKMYSRELEKAKAKVADAYAVCLTTDGWTSTNNDSFIAVTAHYILNSRLESTLLGCVEYAERHTAANLADFLKSVMRDWDIQDKVTAVTSDNAANITAAIRSGDWRHIPCFAHSINLCVQTALTAIAATTCKVKLIVEYFKRSSHALTKLREIQTQLDAPQLKLKQDVSTRWNSTFDMYQRLYTLKDAVTATLALTKPDLMLSTADWATVKAAIPILKNFYDVTNEISAEKNVTLSKVIPMCRIMVANARKHVNELHDIPAIQEMVKSLINELERRFNFIEASPLHAEAAILDPRFKDKGFRKPTLAERAITSLKNKVGRQSHCLRPESQQEQPVQTVPAKFTAQSSLWDDFDKEVALLTPTNPTAAGIVEVEKYLQEPLLHRTSDPFVWWTERRSVYPLLYSIMLKRLNIVATSVPCERIFSKAGNILSEKRTRLGSKKLAQLLFISCNT